VDEARGEQRAQVEVALALAGADEVVAHVERGDEVVERDGAPEQLLLARRRRLRLEDVEWERIAQVVDDPGLRPPQPARHERVGRAHDHHVGGAEEPAQRPRIAQLVGHVRGRSEVVGLGAGRRQRHVGHLAQRARHLVRADRRPAEHLPDAVLRHDQDAAWHRGSVPSGGR
jgi:hypothetical protein